MRLSIKESGLAVLLLATCLSISFLGGYVSASIAGDGSAVSSIFFSLEDADARIYVVDNDRLYLLTGGSLKLIAQREKHAKNSREIDKEKEGGDTGKTGAVFNEDEIVKKSLDKFFGQLRDG